MLGVTQVKNFYLSFVVTIVCLMLALIWGGVNALLVTAILGIMEISLSFDNAVVNASVLKTWDHFWKMLFLTLGILIAVFGMRLLFPLLIVSLTTDMNILDVAVMALNTPDEYAKSLLSHHVEVSVFGGTFLLLVFLNFIFDDQKEVHWLGVIEEKLALLGKLDSVSVLFTLIVILITSHLPSIENSGVVIISGIWGIVTYLFVDVISNFLEQEEDAPALGKTIKTGGIGGFLYLEVLDASFSFDGVIGAFAITKDVVVIMLGLAIGAMFIRSLTVYLVDKGTLDEYVYLENGAHYAIGALAFIMLFGIEYDVPELVTGLIGIALIIMSFYSSILFNKKQVIAQLDDE